MSSRQKRFEIGPHEYHLYHQIVIIAVPFDSRVRLGVLERIRQNVPRRAFRVGNINEFTRGFPSISSPRRNARIRCRNRLGTAFQACPKAHNPSLEVHTPRSGR
jgi:hypothetical protein